MGIDDDNDSHDLAKVHFNLGWPHMSSADKPEYTGTVAQ